MKISFQMNYKKKLDKFSHQKFSLKNANFCEYKFSKNFSINQNSIICAKFFEVNEREQFFNNFPRHRVNSIAENVHALID